MKKVCIITIALLVALVATGCKSKKEKVYEMQIDAIRKIFVVNGLNAGEELKYGIARDLQTKEISNLDLSGRNLTVLPPEIGLLTGLEELDLRKNHLTELPEEIGNLKRLKKLDVSINNLTKLPESIGNLELLEELEVIENQLTSIPESIGELNNLTYFTLLTNKITDLPRSMSKMHKLNHLALAFNPIHTIPKVLSELPAGTKISLSPGFDPTTLPVNIKHNGGGLYHVTNQ